MGKELSGDGDGDFDGFGFGEAEGLGVGSGEDGLGSGLGAVETSEGNRKRPSGRSPMGSGKSEGSTGARAAVMYLLHIWAGMVPPTTRPTPCTLSISLFLSR